MTVVTMADGHDSDSDVSVSSEPGRSPARTDSDSSSSERRTWSKSPDTSSTTTLTKSPKSPKASAATTSTAAESTTAAAAATPSSKKRKDSTASEANGGPAAKITKRRAARACASCRSRKVRCDVVDGAPCGNCRWDNVECVVQESRRRKKNLFPSGSVGGVAPHPIATSAAHDPFRANKIVQPAGIDSSAADLQIPSEGPSSLLLSGIAGSTNDSSQNGSAVSGAGGAAGATLMDAASLDHHLIYQQQQHQSGFRPDPQAELLAKLGDRIANPRLMFPDPVLNPNSLFGDIRTAQFLNSLEEPGLSIFSQLPGFVKPLPGKIAAEDVKFLHAKGALALPDLPLQNALLQAYVEFVHPYMPLIELHDFLNAVYSREGLCGQVSLFLYHAVMFAATAFVDIRHLREAGYPNRKAARRVYFSKTRLLYDFDYESDRLVLVQALLLMTYWYETPDDQKDTWHWMGVAISLAHTIGLHRDPASTNLAPRKQRLWKRIWWSCFMRDRLVALGMRRPTRIKDEDFDVPMLAVTDFDLEALSDENQLLPADCTLVRDLGMQAELAELCVQKAKLCVWISEMLKAQYSVLIRDATKPENTTNSTMMLFPNKTLENLESIQKVDRGLTSWLEALPPAAAYRPLSAADVQNGHSTVAVQRNLLHMVYYTTVSALHRPQFLPSSPLQAPTASRQVQEMSRTRVRESAARITRMAAELHQLRLERFLPTTGVTVILPAMIIHLLEMKNPALDVRMNATKGFRQCLRVMDKLRDIYAAADFASVFLDAAVRKASIDLNSADPATRAGGADAPMAGWRGNGSWGALRTASSGPVVMMCQAQPAHDQLSLRMQKAAMRGSVKPTTIAPALNISVATSDGNELPGGGDELSTPPPEPASYVSPTETHIFGAGKDNLMASNPLQQGVKAWGSQSMWDAPQNVPDWARPTATAGSHTPPHTERDLDSASGRSSGGGDNANVMDMMDMDMDMDGAAADFGTGNHDEFDWTAVTGTSALVDWDQWLQFPAEAGGSSSTAAGAAAAPAATDGDDASCQIEPKVEPGTATGCGVAYAMMRPKVGTSIVSASA